MERLAAEGQVLTRFFTLSPDSAQGSEQQDRATLSKGGPTAAPPGEAAPENPEPAEPGTRCLHQEGRAVQAELVSLDMSQSYLTFSSRPSPGGPPGPHAPGPRGGHTCQEEEATQDVPACWLLSQYNSPTQ